MMYREKTMKMKYVYHRNIYRNYIFMQIYASLGLAGCQFWTACQEVFGFNNHTFLFRKFPSYVELILTLNILSFASFAYMILHYIRIMVGICCEKDFSLLGCAGKEHLENSEFDRIHGCCTWGAWNPLDFLIYGFI
jgi:hypothetical protein